VATRQEQKAEIHYYKISFDDWIKNAEKLYSKKWYKLKEQVVEPRQFIKTLKDCPAYPYLGNGVWLAGGSIVDMMVGREPNDYDIYFKLPTYLHSLQEKLKEDGIKLVSQEGELYNYENGMQLIGFMFFDSPKKIVSRFDLSVCSWATDGKGIWGEECVLDKNFRILNYHSGQSKKRVIERIAKYIKKGFVYCPQAIDLIYLCESLEWEDLCDKYGVAPNIKNPAKIFQNLYKELFKDIKAEDRRGGRIIEQAKIKKYLIQNAKNKIEEGEVVERIINTMRWKYKLGGAEAIVLRTQLEGEFDV